MAIELFTYWQGDIPEHVERCLEISRKYGIHVYDETAMTWPDWVVEPHHRSDYFRAHRLADGGGAYVDADAILYRGADSWFERGDPTFYACGWAPCEPSIGMLYATEDDTVAKLWADAQEAHASAIGWTSLGAASLWPIVAQSDKAFIAPGRYAFAAPFRRASLLAEHRRASVMLEPNAICTHLNNKTTGEYMSDALNDPQSLVSQLMGIARHRAALR